MSFLDRFLRKIPRKDLELMKAWLEANSDLPRKSEEELRINPVTNKLIEQIKLERVAPERMN